jgi:hypothetical protein
MTTAKSTSIEEESIQEETSIQEESRSQAILLQE